MDYISHTLPNGLRLVHYPSDSPVAYCGFAINAGTRDELPGEHGLAHFVEHMLFKGTEKRRAWHILNRMETVGGELNAFTTKEETFVYSVFLEEHFKRAFELQADLILHSKFPLRELEKETDVIKDEINAYKDSPSELIFDDFENLLFSNHSLGHNILGDEDSLKKFSADAGLGFMRRFYTARNMVFFSMGRVKFDNIVRWAEILMEESPQHEVELNRQPPEPLAPSVVRIKKETHQSHVIIGSRSYSMFNDKRMPLFLLNNIIGGPGMNSRLNVVLREKNGLVYTVESNVTSYTDTGVASIYFGTDPKNKQKVIRLIERELDAFCQNLLPQKTLDNAKKQLKGQLGISTDNRESLFLALGKSFLHYNEYDSLPETFELIDAISSEDIRTVACEVYGDFVRSRLEYDG